MPGLQPENVGFDSHRELELKFSVWRSLASRVPRVHEIEGSNPSTLTVRGRVGGRNGNAAGRNPALSSEIHGGSNPSLRIERMCSNAPEVPTAERPPPNREAAGSIPARRA